MWSADAVFRRHDEVWLPRSISHWMCAASKESTHLPLRGQIRHGDVVQALEVWTSGVDLNNDLYDANQSERHFHLSAKAQEPPLSAICMISGLAPTLAPGMIPPSSVMALAS